MNKGISRLSIYHNILLSGEVIYDNTMSYSFLSYYNSGVLE